MLVPTGPGEVVTGTKKRHQRSLRDRLLSGGLWSFSAKLVASVLFLTVNALITRKLPPDEVGSYFLLVSIVSLLASIAQLGTGQAAVRFIASSLAHDRVRAAQRVAMRVLLLCSGAGALISVAYVFASALGGLGVFEAPGLASVAGLTALWLLLLALNRNLSDVFLGYQEIRVSSVIGHSTDGVIQASVLLLLLAVVAPQAMDLNRLMGMSVAGTAVSVAVGLLLLWRGGRLSHEGLVDEPESETEATGLSAVTSEQGGGANGERVGQILRVSLPMMMTAILAYSVSYKFELWIIGVMGNAEDLALYGAAIRLMLLITAPLMVVNSVIPPMVAELHSTDDLSRLEAVLRGSATFAGIPSALVLLSFVAVGGTVLEIAFGSFYREAWLYLLIIGVGQLANVVAGSCGTALMMTGREVLRMNVLIVTSVVGVAGGIWAMSVFGVLGLAVASAAKYALQNAVLVVLAKRHIGVWTHASFRPSEIRRSLRVLRGAM